MHCVSCNNWKNERCQSIFDCRNWEEIEEKMIPHCSFCGKSREQVKKMVGVAGSYICQECADNCKNIMSSDNMDDGIRLLEDKY